MNTLNVADRQADPQGIGWECAPDTLIITVQKYTLQGALLCLGMDCYDWQCLAKRGILDSSKKPRRANIPWAAVFYQGGSDGRSSDTKR